MTKVCNNSGAEIVPSDYCALDHCCQLTIATKTHIIYVLDYKINQSGNVF